MVNGHCFVRPLGVVLILRWPNWLRLVGLAVGWLTTLTHRKKWTEERKLEERKLEETKEKQRIGKWEDISNEKVKGKQQKVRKRRGDKRRQMKCEK